MHEHAPRVADEPVGPHFGPTGQVRLAQIVQPQPWYGSRDTSEFPRR